MAKSIVFMFSGQGSQYYHMGKALYDSHPLFRDWMNRLDHLVYEICGRSIVAYLYNENKRRMDLFDEIRYTHPSIFMVEYALARVLMEQGVTPDYVLGASLGEIASAAIAGVIDYEHAMEAVLYHAGVIENYCRKGGMTAIIGDVNLYDSERIISENSELSSINFYSHFVVSGERNGLDLIERHLKRNEILYQPLPVCYAFHSAFMDPARSEYISYLKEKPCNKPEIKFVSCVSATILNEVGKDYLWEVTRKPVMFKNTIEMMEINGNYIYVDIGPSGTLATFTKYNLPGNSQSETYATITPFGKEMEKLNKVCAVCRN